jgi:glycosyltransferase involved in cell wall biosynthesis
MKVLFIADSQSSHTRRWVTGLSQNGCDMHLLAPSSSVLAGVTIHHQPIYDKNIFRQIRLIAAARKLIRRLKPDVIHLFGLFPLSSLGAMWLLHGLPNVVISVLGSDIVPATGGESRKERFIKKQLLSDARAIVATSKYLAEETRKYIKPAQSVQTLPWGVALDSFTPRSDALDSSGVVVGFAKRLHPLAGPDVLLEAFREALTLNPSIARLRIAGDGPMLPELKGLAETLGISDKVEWVGWVEDPAALSRFYQSIDVFVMPSRRESFGWAAVEAAACGLPIIASRYGGIPEIVADGQTGLLIESEDVAGFGRAIAELATNRAARESMGRNAARRARELFDWQQSLFSMVAVYRQVCGRSA